MAKPGRPAVLSTGTIVAWAVGILLVAAISVAVLWGLFGAGDARDSVRLDALRTAGSIVVGTGGGAALLLAARRQQSAELGQAQSEHDATERRVTELYSKAAEQLGSDKAPVRLAGLYALERLAQHNPAHRQTITHLLCAYLRMPFEPDPQRAEEEQVRRVAQEVLVSHLRPGEQYWPGIELNLTGATLIGLTMTHCDVESARFTSARFVRHVTFRDTTFRKKADFRAASFTGLADFRNVSTDSAEAVFHAATFEEEVNFGDGIKAVMVGALTKTEHPKRRWPANWREKDISERPGWAVLVPAKNGQK